MTKSVVHYKRGPYLPITETWIYNHIKRLKKYQPLVYCHGTENLEIYPTNYIRSLPSPWSDFGLFSYPFFAFCLAKDKPHLVHAHFGPSGYQFLRLKRLFKLPLVTTFYGQDLSMLPQQHPEWKKRYRTLFRQGECFLVEGTHMKQSLTKLGCPKKKIIVQHLGVDLGKIKFQSRKIRGNEGVKVLIAASFGEKKGILYAIGAFGKVRRDNPSLKMKLTIIGDSSGNPDAEKEKKKIFSKIKKYHLKDNVTLLGYQPYPVFLRELYQHHIFLSPSVTAADGDTEGGAPVSIIEASASGMPVLSTIHCDIPEVIVNGKSGYLVSERDVEALSGKLEFLISHPSHWPTMGGEGRKHIEGNYDIRRQVKQLEKIYSGVLNKWIS